MKSSCDPVVDCVTGGSSVVKLAAGRGGRRTDCADQEAEPPAERGEFLIDKYQGGGGGSCLTLAPIMYS